LDDSHVATDPRASAAFATDVREYHRGARTEVAIMGGPLEVCPLARSANQKAYL
jgi:hypothetical protein